MDKILELRTKAREMLEKAKGLLNKEGGLSEEENAQAQTWLDEAEGLEAKAAKLEKIMDLDQKTAAKGSKGNVEVILDEADRPFTSIAEQCKAVKAFESSKGRNADVRLTRLEEKALGASEGINADGGFLLEPTLTREIITPMHQAGPFTRLARKLPVGSNSNYGHINGVDETSRANGSRWGGIRGYRLAEGQQGTPSRPKFRRINWELGKYAIFVYGTDELLADAPQFSAIVQQGSSEELSFMVNDDLLNGVGAGFCLGVMNSGALIPVAAEAGQAAATIVVENLNKMWARLDSRSKGNAVWFINTDVNPQLDSLAMAVGMGALEPRFVTYGPDGALRIKGRPVVETEFNETLGTLGDIVLADYSQYLMWEKSGVAADSSIHVAFLTDEMVFRFIARVDGKPVLSAPLTPYKGTNTVSPFVALATRS